MTTLNAISDHQTVSGEKIRTTRQWLELFPEEQQKVIKDTVKTSGNLAALTRFLQDLDENPLPFSVKSIERLRRSLLLEEKKLHKRFDRAEGRL